MSSASVEVWRRRAHHAGSRLARVAVPTLAMSAGLVFGCSSSPETGTLPSASTSMGSTNGEATARDAGPSSTTSRSATSTLLPDGTLSFVETMSGGAAASSKVPLVIALHGFGDRPDAFVHVLRKLQSPARIVALRAPIVHGDGFSWFTPVKQLADRDSSAFAADISSAVTLVSKTIDSLVKSRPTAGKPIVLGFSQGGMLSWAMAAGHPDQIAAALPMSGMLPQPLFPTALSSPSSSAFPSAASSALLIASPSALASASSGGPASSSDPRHAPSRALPKVIAFHGEADERVPFSQGVHTVQALEAAGYPIQFQRLAGVGHTIPESERQALIEALAAIVDEQSRAP